MATCYITMICDEVWVDRGESAINESCYRPILVESSPAQWCITSQPTLRQKLEHTNIHHILELSAPGWQWTIKCVLNVDSCFLILEENDTRETSDIVLSWHIVTVTRTLSSWVSWPVPMCWSWYVTVLSFWFVFTQADCLMLVTIW